VSHTERLNGKIELTGCQLEIPMRKLWARKIPRLPYLSCILTYATKKPASTIPS